MQVICDPRDLNSTQRRAVADFILNFPSACAATCSTLGPHEPAAEISDVELATLQHDHESTMPDAAFGKPDEAAVAFGSVPPPLPPAATAAPFIAVAAQSSIAPAATTETSGAATLGVPVPPAPTTAPAAPVPTAPVAPSSHAGGVELDKHGLPWDNRIHAESKAKIADGTWRKKRNVDPGLVAQVEGELRQLMGAPAAPVTANLPTASASPVAVPQPPAPQAPAAGDERQQFVALIGRTSAALQGGKITQDEINQCCQAVGVPALPLLANRLDLVANVAGSIDAIVASRPE